MGTRHSYQPGTFCAVDLATTDPSAAREFYGPLFGWQGEDVPFGEGSVYTMLTLDGDYVAGLYPQPELQRTAGVPPNWFSYISVASADATAARALELGGQVHAEPSDVATAGRMAVIADPAGAMFGAWEPRETPGAARVNDPGCLTANELSTTAVDRVSAFYTGLFGWRVAEAETGGGPRYWLIDHAGAAEGRNGGIRELAPAERQAGVPSQWMPYFTVGSVDEATATARRHDGTVHVEPLQIPAGWIAVVADPQGAIFGIFEGDVDD